jgi:malate permease and related proteins
MIHLIDSLEVCFVIGDILTVLLTIILPIFILIGLGVIFDRAFKPDRDTMSKLNFYFLIPAIVFTYILSTNLSFSTTLLIGSFSTVHFFILFTISFALFSVKRYKEKRTVMALGIGFFNCGNYGIPLVIFAFGSSRIDILTVIIVLQNILLFTVGIWLMERDRLKEERSKKKMIVGLLKIPVIYAVILGILLHPVAAVLPATIIAPITYLSNSVVALALITLGIGLSRTRFSRTFVDAVPVIVLRLVIAPVIAYILVMVFGMDQTLLPILVVTAGLPAAVNVYILAAEYHNHEEIASQSIFWTTLLSAISISILLVLFTP